MARTPIWKSITSTLAREIAEGQYPQGGKLPTEAALAARFGVNRHTVRHALAALAESGTVYSRRGAGVFVSLAPTDYPIGKRTRFHRNIEATGRLAHKHPLRVETRACNATEANALRLTPGDRVTVYEGLSMSGKATLAHFESIFPADRLPGIARTFATVTSVTQALAANGVADYTRRDTRISAELASA
ncbi:phosphonate metabolism transcriptional regulator PhnF, partial [Actibacterium sp.]|uniref:phosphonate metabolism transcriptional regulator PhnF n=1 Tax=Actibacterium sp. TaxID=1872125 RepID=UPI0035672153